MWLFKSKPVEQVRKVARNWVNSRLKVSMRLFDAAKKESFWSSWSTTAATVDQAIYEDWFSLVARSREQYANNDWVRRYVNLSIDNIIGEHGIMVQSKVKDRRGEQDRPVQRIIEEHWEQFALDVTPAGLTLQEMEALTIQGCITDGEVFIRRTNSRAHKYGVKFDFIDAILCPTTYYDATKRIYHGIEFAESGETVAYYFARTVDRKNGQNGQNVRDYQRVPADQIIHVFLPEWVGQKRGIPWIATSLGPLKDLDGYQDAAVINARIGASKMGFFESDGVGEFVGDTDEVGNTIMEADPGSFEVLPDGMKFSSWNPDYPHQQYSEFVSANLGKIAAGMGVAKHSLSGDMTEVNFSSARIAELMQRDRWRVKQKWLINKLVRPIFESFIQYGIDSGAITFNGRPLREQPEFYFPAWYQGRRWAWVDPTKEIKAAKESVEMRVKSLSSIIREDGLDPETVWSEIAEDRQFLDSLGIGNDNPTNEETNDAA